VLHDVGPTAIKAVQGDLSLRDADGDVQVEVVRGDAKLKHVAGSVAINKVAGDLVASDLGGGLAINMVGGDASLQTSLVTGQVYALKTGGDIIFRVEGGGGQFALNCKGDLRVRLPMTNWAGNDRSATGTYGDGSAQVTLMANGDLLVLPATTGTSFDPDVLSEQVEAMIESAMSQFETQMSQVQHDLEQRFGKFDKQAEKAAERAARSAERAKRRAERAASSWGFTVGRPPVPPTPPSEPVSDQERLLILKMVEEGKITADQAAQLLAALEG
jgi:SHOCT-like domain